MDPLKRAYNPFFEAKKGFFLKNPWPEQSDIIFLATSGIPRLNDLRIQQGESPIDAINENFFSGSQRIGIVICNGYIKRENGTG